MNLQSTVLRAESILNQVYGMVSEYDVENNTRKKMMARLLSLVIEHYESIVLLIKNKKYGSASALVRPLVEAEYRSTWLALCCTDEKAKQLSLNDRFDKVSKLSAAIGLAIKDEVFKEVYAQNSKALNSYTHGGMHQIARRFNDKGDIEATFSEEELIDLLNVTGVNVLMSCLSFFSGIEDSEKAKLARQYILDYSLLGASPNSSPFIT
jgi:hypothetical protein